MSSSPGDKKMPKKDRKALARELARIERERQEARRRRNRRLGWLGAGTGVVAVGVIAALVVQSNVRAGQIGPNNMLSDGIVFSGDGESITATRTSALAAGQEPTATVIDRSSGVLDLVLYQDYRDPDAGTLWSTAGEAFTTWVTYGYATLEIHPLALLDETTVSASEPSPSASATAEDTEASGDATEEATAEPTAAVSTEPYESTGDYSARAANALACVADTNPDLALDVHQALIDAQATLDEDGLSQDELVNTVVAAGVTDQAVADCITDDQFGDWVQKATARAAKSVPYDIGSVDTSPVLLVGGQEYTGSLTDMDELTAFIQEVSDQLYAEAQAEAEASAAATADPTDAATEESAESTAEPTEAATSD